MTPEETQDLVDDGPVYTHSVECTIRALKHSTQGMAALVNLLLSQQLPSSDAQATYVRYAQEQFEEVRKWIEKAQNP